MYIILGLYYDSIQNDIGVECVFLEVNCLNVVMLFLFEFVELVDILVEVDGVVMEFGVEDLFIEGVFGVGILEFLKLFYVQSK